MLTIGQYARPESLDEAYALCQKKNNVGAGRHALAQDAAPACIGTAIDLCDLGLDHDRGGPRTAYRIGAMVSLRALEQHAGPRRADRHGAMAARGTATSWACSSATAPPLGGSLFGPVRLLGRADAASLALDARVHAAPRGRNAARGLSPARPRCRAPRATS